MPQSPHIKHCPLCGNNSFEKIYVKGYSRNKKLWWTRSYFGAGKVIRAYRCTACYFVAYFAIE